MIDIDRIVHTLQDGLPDAAPFAAIPMLTAQIPYIDAEAGVSLIEGIVANVQPSVWAFTDDELDQWPEPVTQRALSCIRTLPPGPDRIEALCGVARRLTLQERREALDGILDKTFPEGSFAHTKPISNRETITYLIRTLPTEWQEEWIATKAIRDKKPNVLSEARARREVGQLTETALRDMWSRLDPASIARVLAQREDSTVPDEPT